jgi:hypothetical protein
MMPTFPRSPLSFRAAGFPQYDWKAGFPSGAFLDRQQLKPAPGIRRPSSRLHPPFVHTHIVKAMIPHCVGPQTRLRTALDGYCSSTPAPSAGAIAKAELLQNRTSAVATAA